MQHFAVILCVVALATLIGPALATPVLEGSAPPPLPAAGDTSTVTISLAGAETGLSGYNLTLSLAPVGPAEIVSVAFPSWAGMPVNGTLPASSTYIQAVDLERRAEPGASPIPLITVTLRALADGETVLTALPVIVDDDQGGRYTIGPLQVPIRVGTVPAETTLPGTMPTASQASSSSGNAPVPGASITPNPLPSPAAPLPAGTVESVTAATTAPHVSLSSSSATPAGEQTTPSAKATPEFNCITACFAGLVISALVLLNRKPW